jgi:hypothetical protein
MKWMRMNKLTKEDLDDIKIWNRYYPKPKIKLMDLVNIQPINRDLDNSLSDDQKNKRMTQEMLDDMKSLNDMDARIEDARIEYDNYIKDLNQLYLNQKEETSRNKNE